MAGSRADNVLELLDHPISILRGCTTSVDGQGVKLGPVSSLGIPPAGRGPGWGGAAQHFDQQRVVIATPEVPINRPGEISHTIRRRDRKIYAGVTVSLGPVVSVATIIENRDLMGGHSISNHIAPGARPNTTPERVTRVKVPKKQKWLRKLADKVNKRPCSDD